MKCKLKIETILDTEESKILYKLIGNLSVSMERELGMNQREIDLLSAMHRKLSDKVTGYE